MTKRKPSRVTEESGRFAYEGLDRVLHEKARLGILTSLASHPDGVLFTDLKHLCALSDGNLSRHIKTLQDARLVQVWKGYQNNRPQTLVRLSPTGRERFFEYLDELQRVVLDAQAVRESQPKPKMIRDGDAGEPNPA